MDGTDRTSPAEAATRGADEDMGEGGVGQRGRSSDRLEEATASEGLRGLLTEEMGGGAHLLVLRPKNRRMSKDYERLRESSEAFIYVAMSRLMVRRLAHR
jgi:hypothetical protein